MLWDGIDSHLLSLSCNGLPPSSTSRYLKVSTPFYLEAAYMSSKVSKQFSCLRLLFTCGVQYLNHFLNPIEAMSITHYMVRGLSATLAEVHLQLVLLRWRACHSDTTSFRMTLPLTTFTCPAVQRLHRTGEVLDCAEYQIFPLIFLPSLPDEHSTTKDLASQASNSNASHGSPQTATIDQSISQRQHRREYSDYQGLNLHRFYIGE